MDEFLNNIENFKQSMREFYESTFEIEFERCWHQLRNRRSEKIQKVKQNFAKEISRKIHKHCWENFKKENVTPPTVEEVVNSVFEYHYFFTAHLSDEERAQKQKEEAYSKNLQEEVYDVLWHKARHIAHRALGSSYYPEIYTVHFLCDWLLWMLQDMAMPNLSDADERSRRDVLGLLFCKAFLNVKTILNVLTVGLPSEAVPLWRSLFELECKILLLNRYDSVLMRKYLVFGEFSDLDEDSDEQKWQKLREYAEHFQRTPDFNFRNYGWILCIKDAENCAPTFKRIVKQCGQEERYFAYQEASKIVHSNAKHLKYTEGSIYNFLINQTVISLANLKIAADGYFQKYEAGQDAAKRKELDKLYNKMLSVRSLYLINCGYGTEKG